MKKRFFVLFFALIACFALAVFTACGGGDEDAGNGGGGPVVENPDDPGGPSDPGSVDPATCSHPNATGVTTEEAGCETPGTMTYTCPDCNKTWTDTIQPLGHNKKYDPTNSRPATCTQEGITAYTCERCGLTGTDTVQRLPHEYEELSTTEATCKSAGSIVYKCQHCTDTYTEELPKLSHLYEYSKEDSEAPTCTEAGFDAQKCTVCGDISKTPVPATGHTFSGPACVDRICAVCSAPSPATEAHQYAVSGTRMEEDFDENLYCSGEIYTVYTCTVCQEGSYEKLSQAATPHEVTTWEEGALHLVDDRNCTYSRENEGQCTHCGHTVTQTQTVENYHDFKKQITKEATCVAEGEITEICTVCQTQGKKEPFSALDNHLWNGGTKVGNVTTFACTREGCSHTKTSIVAGANEKTLTADSSALKDVDEVEVKGASVKMDATAKAALPEGNLTLGVDTVAAGDVEHASPDVFEGKDVKEIYEITLKYGDNGDLFTNFGNGKVTVRVPYELQDGDDPTAIEIWYVNDKGELEAMNAVYSGGYAVFETTHFSYYTVGIMTPEEMCVRYGHNYIENKRPATCTTSGYETKVCTRCGYTAKNDVLPALGHTWVEVKDESRAATCTTSGQKVERCEHQDVCHAPDRVTTLPATGHVWEKSTTECKPASCTAAGKDVYNCKNCEEKRETTIPQIAHTFKETVTPATCTVGGYTTFECSVCQYKYVGAQTLPKGHTWNIPHATCTEGQTCTVCHAKGEQATGHSWDIESPTCTQGQTCTVCGTEGLPPIEHTYGAGGYCTVCGEGCKHQFVVKDSKASTCIVAGYTVSECSVCHQTKREELPLADHKYDESTGLCTVCGKADPDLLSEYLQVVESLKADCYTVSLSGLTMKVTMPVSSSELGEENILIKDGVGYFGFKNGVPMFRLTVDSFSMRMQMPNGNNQLMEYSDIELCYNGEHLIIKYTENGEASYQRLRADLAESEQFGMALMLMQDETIRTYLSDLVSKNGRTISALLETFAAKLFTRVDDASGYTLTLDRTAILALNYAFANRSVADVADLILGEGKFDELTGFVKGILGKSAKDAVDDILARVAPYHIAKEELFPLIDYVLGLVMPRPAGSDPVKIEDIYGSDEWKTTTFAEALFGERASQITSSFDGYMQAFHEMTPYDLLESLIRTAMSGGMGGGASGDAGGSQAPVPDMPQGYAETYSGEETQSIKEIISSVVASLFSDDSVTLSLRVEGGKAQKLTLALKDVSLTDLPDGVSFSVNGSLELTFGGTVDTETEDRDGTLLSAIRRRVESAKDKTYELELEDYTDMYGNRYVIRAVFTLGEGGVLQAELTEYELYDAGSAYTGSRTGWKSVAVFTNVEKADLTVAKGCGANVSVFTYRDRTATETRWRISYTIAEDGSFETTELMQEMASSNSAFSVGFNETQGSFVKNYRHNFVIDPKQSETAESVECEHYYTVVEVCSQCGETRERRSYRSHSYDWRYELKKGATSCVEGVDRVEYCVDCGKVFSRHTEYGSHVFGYKTTSYKTEYGTVVLVLPECLCGLEITSREMYVDIKGLDGSSERYYGWQNVGEVLYSVTFESGRNPWRIVISGPIVKDGCYMKVNGAITITYGGIRVVNGESISYVIGTDHAQETKTTYTYEEKDGVKTTRTTVTTYTCEHGFSLTETVECRYDDLGRQIYKCVEMKRGNETISYSRTETTYDGCKITRKTYSSPADNEPETYTSTNHSYVDRYKLLGSDCLDGVEVSTVCEYCGEQEGPSRVIHEHVTPATGTYVYIGDGAFCIHDYVCLCGSVMTSSMPFGLYYLSDTGSYSLSPQSSGDESKEMVYVTFNDRDLKCVVTMGDLRVDGCYTRADVTFSFRYGEKVLKTLEKKYIVSVQHEAQSQVLEDTHGGEYGAEGFRKVTQYTYACGHSQDYTETEEMQYDEFGRKTLEHRERVTKDGAYLMYSRTEYEYKGCTCTVRHYNSLNGEPKTDFYEAEHHFAEQYVLNGESCTDGYYRAYKCVVCGEETDRSETRYDHSIIFKQELYTTKDGTFAVEYWGCPCGQVVNGEPRVIHLHGEENEEMHQEGGEPLPDGEGWAVTLRCNQCAVTITETVNTVREACYDKAIVTLNFDEETRRTFTLVVDEHHVDAKEEKVEEVVYDLEKNGYTGNKVTYEYTYNCGHINSYRRTEESRYDKFGRLTYHLIDEFELNTGKSREYRLEEYQFVRDGSCECLAFVTDTKDGERREEGRREIHAESAYKYDLQGHDSCEEGVLVTRTCPVCEQVLDSYTINYHATLTRETPIYNNGVLAFIIYDYTCPCGEQSGAPYFNGQGGDASCYIYLEHGSASDTSELGNGRTLYTYNCAETDCTVKVVEEYWETVNGCDTTHHYIFKFYDGERQFGDVDGYEYEYISTYHQWETKDDTYQELDNGGYRHEYTYYYPCKHRPDEHNVEIVEYDEYGRTIHTVSYTEVNGEYTYYSEQQWEFQSSCVATVRYRHEEGGEWNYGDTKTVHVEPNEYGEVEWFDATCTQYGYRAFTCVACSEYIKTYNDYPHGHEYVDGVCYHCGLQNVQETDGVVILEDMTEWENPDGESVTFKVGAWGRDAEFEDLTCTTELVFLNEEGIEQTLTLERDWEKLLTYGRDPQFDWYWEGDSYVFTLTLSMEDLAAAEAEAQGWTFVGVRLNFLARFNSGSQAVSITLTPPTEG